MIWLLRVKTMLEKILEHTVIVSMAALVLDVLWQVFSRYILNAPSPWTEELATILLIWTSLMGAPLAYAAKEHLGVDFLVNKLPARRQRSTRIFSHLAVALFSCLVMIRGGGLLMENAFNYHQLTPVLGINWAWIYLAAPVSGVFFTLFAIEFLLEAVNEKPLITDTE